MGLLNRIFGRGDGHQAPLETECPHTALTPRWDNLDDMGKEDRAVRFHCEGCGVDFSGDEGRRLLH